MSESSQDQTRFDRFEWLIAFLYGRVINALPANTTLAGPWTLVNATPFNATGKVKFRVDASTIAPVINLGALAAGTIIIVSRYAGINPITVVPASGTIADPSNGGTQQARASLGSAVTTAWWQQDATTGNLIGMV